MTPTCSACVTGKAGRPLFLQPVVKGSRRVADRLKNQDWELFKGETGTGAEIYAADSHLSRVFFSRYMHKAGDFHHFRGCYSSNTEAWARRRSCSVKMPRIAPPSLAVTIKKPAGD